MRHCKNKILAFSATGKLAAAARQETEDSYSVRAMVLG